MLHSQLYSKSSQGILSSAKNCHWSLSCRIFSIWFFQRWTPDVFHMVKVGCLVSYIVTSFIHLSLYRGYVEFICPTETSGRAHMFWSGGEWSGETANWMVPWPSPNLRKTEHLSTFLWGAAQQAPGLHNFGLPGGECVLKMPYLLLLFFLTLCTLLYQEIQTSLLCSSEQHCLGLMQVPEERGMEHLTLTLCTWLW